MWWVLISSRARHLTQKRCLTSELYNKRTKNTKSKKKMFPCCSCCSTNRKCCWVFLCKLSLPVGCRGQQLILKKMWFIHATVTGVCSGWTAVSLESSFHADCCFRGLTQLLIQFWSTCTWPEFVLWMYKAHTVWLYFTADLCCTHVSSDQQHTWAVSL